MSMGGHQTGKRIGAEQIPSLARRPTARNSPSAPSPADRSISRRRLVAFQGLMDKSRRADSLDAFLRSPDSFWQSQSTSYRDAPIFADHEDKQIFYSSKDGVVGQITDLITLVRRSNQYVSTLRFSEGSIFDSSGVSHGLGYLQHSPTLSWLSKNKEGAWLSEQALAEAPHYDKSYLIFYNGNLHNYYHWTLEGLLPLSVLSQAFGPDRNLQIALPRSRHIAAVFDHRDSLRATGLDGHKIIDIAADLIKVREAIWVQNGLVQFMPAPYLRAFQKKVAALHAGSRLRKKRRLLVARKGPTRMIHNFRQVYSFLSKHGFETVYLDGMSVVDQIVLFQNAEFIVGPHGAGLANLLFCDPGTKVIEFMPSAEMRPFFWLISEKLGLVDGMLFCAAANGEGFQASVEVDVNKLEALYRMVDAHN
jgi:capsular polysaccharide biosynthesis protein